MKQVHFENPDVVRRYAQGPTAFVPAYEQMQRMTAQLIKEGIGDVGELLVLGAGGGLELEVFASLQSQWRYIGVDPAAEMLNAAKARLAAIGASERAQWHHGYITDAPAGPFDAASCLLTLHFVADDGSKLHTLIELKKRLKSGAPFVLVDCCIDTSSPSAELMLARYRDFALGSGADPELVSSTCDRLVNVLKMVSPERNEALLKSAGFTDVELFYAGLSWRGWRATA